MASVSKQNSTIVRNPIPWSFRAAVRVGSVLAPRALERRALNWFCTPMASSRRRAATADSGGASVDRLLVGGAQLAVYRWGAVGSQPTVLLSHGWSSFGLRFLPWVPALQAAGYAVLAFDQPGHGRNAPARITLPGFVDTVLAVGRAYGPFAAAIGHSLGGAAVATAMAEGMRAERALLIAPAADAIAASRRFARAIDLPEPRRRAMQGLLEETSGRDMRAFSAQHIVPTLGLPALIVHDLADREVPWEEGERYARFWPGARLLSVDGLGHHKIVTAPEVLDAGLRFMRGEVLGERVVSTQQLVYGYA